MNGYHLKLGRDNSGLTTYALPLYQAKRTYSIFFQDNDEGYVPLIEGDQQAIIFTDGGRFQISNIPNPAPAAVVNGAAFPQVNTNINQMAISLDGWPFPTGINTEKRIYIKSLDSQNITVKIY